MAKLSPRPGKKIAKPFWGASRLSAAFRPLPRSLRYSVESLEPRYLLSGVALTNATNDGTKPVDSSYVTAVSNAVQTVIGKQTQTGPSIIGNLSYLGQQIDKTSITDATASAKIPLLNQTPNQLDALATTGSGFGSQAGNITFGSLLLNDTDNSGNNLFTQDLATFLTNSTNANNLTSTTLAGELQKEGQILFGNAFTVTDKSSGTTLDLQVSFTADTFHSVPIDIGQSAGEYNLLLASEATGSPNVTVETKLSATYDITADLSTFNTAYNSSSAQKVANEDNTFNAVTTPTSFQQSAQVTNTPLPTFGIEFGVIGAGSPGIIENDVALTNNSTAVTLNSAAGLSVGMSVQGTGISAGTTIAAINNNQITLSIAATSNETNSQLTIGAVNGAYINAAAFVEGSVEVTNASNIVTLSSVAGLQTQELVQGIGIPAGTKITGIDTTNDQLTLSHAATISGAETLTINATSGFALNEQMSLTLADATLNYANIGAETYQFTAPVTNPSNITAVNIGTSSAPNTAEFNTGNIALEDVASLPGYIGTLNPTGSFTFYSDNLFDGHPALVYPGSPELANLARISNADLVIDAQNADTLIGELNNVSALQSNVPFSSETLGSAYDFGTAAEIGFVDALQQTSVVLTGTSSPGTYNSAHTLDQTDLSGSGTFALEVILSSGVISTYTISVAAGASNRTLQGLVTALQNGLKNATNTANNSTVDLTGSFTAQVSGQALQLVSNVSGIQFFLSNFSSDTASPAQGTLNLGFNSYGSVALYANGNIDTTANYQLPGVVLTSSSAVNLTDFNTETQFGIKVNNGTNSTYGPGYVTVTLAAGSYTENTLVQALTNALQQAGLNDGYDTYGVLVRAVTVGSGFGLQFYGGDDVYQLSMENVSTPGSSSALGKLQLTTTSVTAPYFNLSINGGAATPVYINGNFTTGLLDNLAAAGSLSDLTYDLQLALVASGALSADQSTGITVNSTATSNGNELVFSAVNPGSGPNQISKFSITGQSGLTSLNLVGSSNNNSLHWAMGTAQTQPAFVTIQDLETLLIQHGVMLTGTYGTYDSTSETFTFPLQFTVNSGSNQSTFPDLSIPLSFDNAYGSVSNLQSSSTVGLHRSDTIQFNFGFNLTPQTTTAEVLTATLPLVIPLWDIPANQTLQSSSPLLFDISADSGVVYTLQLNQVLQSDGTSKFYSSTDNSSTATDFITALNTALTESGLQVTAAFSPEDGYGRSQIVFTTAAGAYRELVVTVPATSSGVVAVPDSAWNNLGFGAATGTTASTTSDTNNQITGPSAVTFVLNGANNTIPDSGNFYVTLPDGTNTAFTFNPANLPANASITDVINELNYEISSTPSMLGSSFGAIGTSTVKMSLTSGSSTAVIDASSTIDPTPYINLTNDTVGAGYGIIPGMALSGTGLANGTTITSVTYDPNTGTIHLGLSAAATSSTSAGAVTVVASPSAIEYNILPKLIASADTNGSTTQIVLSLNPQVFGPSQQGWNLQVASTYLQQLDNPASLELGLPANIVSDSAVSATGITSTIISPSTFTNWTSNTPASFQVSINGSSYVTVTLHKSDLPSDTIAGLISALNTKLAATSINLSVPGAPNSTNYNLGDFLTAQATDGGTNVLIRLINGASPAVSGARFALTSGANVMNNAGVLGFFTATGPTEYIFGQRGAEAVVNSPVLSGILTISGATFTGAAQFGFVDFNVGNGVLNETTSLIFSSTNSSSTLLDLNQAISDAANIDSSLYGSYGITVRPATQADVLLESLSFPNATSISNLNFGNGAVIEISYPLSTAPGATGHYITDFSNLPPPEITYTNTNGMELLTRLSFSDIANGLMRIGDAVSDWMKTDLNDPFSSSLLYSNQTLVQIDDLGADFKALIQQIESQPPSSLQATAQALANGLQLPVGSIQLSISNTSSQNGGQLALQVSFDWVKSLTQTLPLSVDLATMYDKASANNGTGQTPQIDLLGLNAIAGSGVNPLNVILDEVSSLNVNLSLVVAQAASGSVLPTAIQTEAILNQPSSGNFFETRFFLTGDNLSGELPAGVDYLQLTNGSVAIDATGQTDIPYASQSSTGTLILTNSTGANTSSQLTGSVNYDSAGDSGLIIQGVTTLPFSVPVVNGVITGSGLFTINGVTPVVGSQILVNTADSYTMLANASYSSTNTAQNYVLSGIASSLFAHLSVGQGISGSFLPEGTTIVSINASGNQITLSNPISGTGSQTQGVFFIQQNAAAVNGLYTVTQNNSTNGYILTLAQSISTLNSSTTPSQRFVVTSAPGSSMANQVYESSGSIHYAAVTTSPNNLDAYGTPYTYDLTAASTFTAPTVVNVLAASTASMALSGTGTSVVIDGATLSSNGEVILNHQATTSQNGLYNLAFNPANGGTWTLTSISTPANLSTATRYSVQHGTVYGGTLMAAYGATQFAVMLQPASYSYNLQSFNNSTSEILPYTVAAATDAALSSVATYTNGIFTSNSQISLNAQVFTGSDNSVLTGIDGVQTLSVGSLILVKNETGANAYENGVYTVTNLGASGTSDWTLQRADFAATPAQALNLRIAVDQGHTNADTRWVQTDSALANSSVFSSGVGVTFSNQLGLVYKNGTTTWLTPTINGASQANLPLQLVQVNNDGTQTLINRDLGNVNADAKTALGGDEASIINDPLYLYYQSLVNGHYVITPTPVFTSLDIVIPSLNNFFTSPSTGTLFFNPAPGYSSSNTNTQNNPPALVNSATSADVLTQLQNGFYIGDALDLALFSIQSAMDEAMGIELPLLGTNLNLYTSYVEQIRRSLTTNIRNFVLANPLIPVDDIRNALFATLGNNPGGLDYLTSESQITVNLYSGSTATAFDFNQADLVNYVQTPLGLKNTVAGSVTAITFGIELQATKGGAGYNDNKINQVDLADSTLGAVISTNTVSSTGTSTTGGVDLQTYFNFNFGFGASVTSGFFIFNPTSTDATPPVATATDNSPLSMIDLDFLAQLTGNINATGVTPFVQTDYSSTLQNLQVNVADGRATTDSKTAGGDGYASGIFGDVIFDLNNHITGGSDPLGRTGASQGVYATVDDLRVAQELGANVTTAAQKPSALLNFEINADADIDLLIESKQAGLIPAIETDLVEAARYGTGAAASFNLNFQNNALIGLGNQTLGSTVMGDYNSYYSATTADNNNAAYNALSATAKSQIDTDYENASPLWRFERGLLTANGQSGNIFTAYQNLSVDVYDYLSGPFFQSLIHLENAIAPLRPVLDFLTTPVPGTSWMPTPLILINLFPATASPKSTSPTEKSNAGGGAKAASVLAATSLLIQILHSIDNMLGPLAEIAATASATAPWQHPQAALGGQASWSDKPLQLNGITDQKNAQNTKLYKEALAASRGAAQTTSNTAEEESFPIPGEDETPAEQNQSNISNLVSSLKEAVTTPNKYSSTFDSLQNGEFFDTTKGNALTKFVKGSLNEQAVKNDKNGGQFSISVGISGGAFYLDAFSPTSILELLNGQNANLLQIQLPAISATFAYLKTFPLPAFPPLQLRLGIQFTLTVDFNLGYDSNGFYWNTIDLTTGLPAPLFSFTVQFSIGVGLDFGLVSVSIDLFFSLTVGFIWNDVSGTGVLHQSDIDYLESQHQSLFAVDLKGQIGFHFEIDLTIPLLFTSITIPIYQYTYTDTVFDFLLGSYTGHIQLGSVTNGVLQLNMGPYASDRNYVNTSNRNEVFSVYGYNGNASASSIESSGETVVVEFNSGSSIYYQEFTGVKQVVGYAGVGDSAIYAGTADTLSSTINLVGGGTIAANTVLTALDYAVVDFYGGAGNVVLQAGASYYSGYVSTYGRSRLVGGTATSLLDGSVSSSSLDLIAGLTTTTIEGSTAGGDNIVARQGSDLLYGNGANDTFTFTNGFGHDRIYVTGNGNSVNFSGLTLLGEGGNVPPITISAVTTAIDFQFGQLVDDAVTGNSTVFFAVDPSEKNSIDTWTGGTGNDLFTVFFFAPDQTLNLNETINSGTDQYQIYLGDPNIHYYLPGDPRNTGTINIHDNSTIQGEVFLTQLFSNTITYNSTGVSNGREQMTFSPALNVNLDAPDATLYWGNPNSPSTYTPQSGGNISVGHLVLLGNVLLSNAAVIHLTHSFLLNYDIDVEGGTLTNPASIEFDLRTDNPSVDANFVLANNSNTNNPSRLMISTGTSQDGNGIGNIFLNVYTGSILNQSGTTNYGVIELGTGTLVMLALETIGTLSSPINVRVDNLTAKTTTTLNPLFTYGIFLSSDQNLNLTGYGSVSGNPDDNILGLTTVNGDIWVSLAPTFALTYYQLIAGGSGNITIIADHVSVTTGFNVIENELQAVPHTYTYSFVYFYPVFFTYSVNYFFFNLYYTAVIFLPEIFTYSYTYYTFEVLPTAVTISPSGAKIQGAGNLMLENATSAENIQVGGSALLPSTTGFLISDALLGSVVTGFATLTIGRPKPSNGGSSTGTVTLAHAENFNQAASVLLQGNDLIVDYSISASNLLTFNAYNVGSGTSVNFTTTTNTYQAATLVLTTDQTADLSLHGLFSSTAAGGSIQINTGGNLNLFGSIVANNGNASKIIVQAAGAITVDNEDQLKLNPSTYYNSLSAYQGVGDTQSEIDLTAGQASGIGISQSTTDAHTGVIAPNMSLAALGSIVLSTQMDTLLLASGTSLNLTNKNLAASLWTINKLTASSGGITIDDDAAGIDLVRTVGNALANLISTAANQTVSITAGGAFTGDSTGSTLDISTTDLTMRTAGGITGSANTDPLLIHAAQLDVVTSAAGDVRFSNVNSAINLTQIVTDNGLISLQSNDDITVDKVLSDTSSASNSITLTTTLGQGGNINLGNLVGGITGIVNAGALGAVTISADGLIKGALTGTDITTQLDLITGSSVSLTSNATAGTANAAILAAVQTGYLDAVTNNSGQIQIYAQGVAPTGNETSENLYLHNLESAQGNIVVIGAASSQSVLPLNFVTGDVNAQASDLTLETSGAITQNTNAPTPTDILDLLVFQLHAGLLITQSTGTSYLNTAVVSLDSVVLGTGSLTIIARGTLDVYKATTQNGSITIQGDASLDADTIRVGTINAGQTGNNGTKSDVSITTTDGAILDLNTVHNNVGTTLFNTYVTEFGTLTGLTAARFTATTAFGIQGLTTQVDTLDASSTQNLGTAEMILTQTGDITIDNVAMTAGNFALTSNGNITVTSLTSDLVASEITLITTAGWIKQNVGTLATVANITGYSLDLQAVNGILLNTGVSLLYATNSGGTDLARANITLVNLATTEFDVSFVMASHGNIDLTTAGDLVLENLPLNQTVYLSTPTNGASSVTPYHVNVTTGGKFLGGTTGTGAASLFDIVTDNATLNVATSIDGLGDSNTLVTEISKLTATTSGTGDISVTNRGALELVNIDAHNGPIFIQNDAELIVDAVTIDTSALLNTVTLQNTLGSTAANITLGTINAGTLGDVTMTSTGRILGGNGNLITGKHLTLTAQGLAGSTTAAIDVNVLGSVLTANATGTGEIIIHTAGDLTLDQVDTASGDIHITTTGTASLLVSEVEAGTTVSFANDVYLTVAGTIGEYKPNPASPSRTYKIISDLLTVMAGSTIYLDTTIQTLDASVTGTGTLTVDQTSNLNIYSATTANGAITITAIHGPAQSGANIFVGTLTAGASIVDESNVNLTATGGYIQDLDVTTITDPAIVPANPFLPLLSGATFTATADYGIHGLHTAVTTFDATTTANNAYILVTEKDDINIDHILMPYGNFTLTAGGTIDVNDLSANTSSSTVNLTSLNSRIKQEVGKINANILNAVAATGIQALTNINDLTATISGSAGDINILNDGNLTVEQVYTPNGTATLDLTTGSLTPSLLTNPLGTPPTYHIYANDIVINTTAGIGFSNNYLSVYADEIDMATASISGGIYIHNYKQVHSNTYLNGFELHQILANNAPISIISAGDTYARDVEIHQDANLNDVTLTSTDSGNILVNFIGTGLIDAVPGSIAPLNGLVNIISAGDIEAVDPNLIPMLQAVNIVAKGINLSAQTGIGSGNTGLLITGKYLTASTVTGNIIAGNSSSTDFFINGFTTGSGDLAFTQKGGGALHATNLTTLNGNIALTVGNGAYLFLGVTTGFGDTTFVSDHINFEGGTGSIFGTGTLNIHPDSATQYVELNSYFASTIYETANTLEISKVGFEAFFTDFQTILIGNQSSRQLTYMYYDVTPGDEGYLGKSSVTSQVPTSVPNVDLFRVTDLFLTSSDLVILQAADAEEIAQILDTELNIGNDDGGAELFDDSDSSDDFFSFAEPASVQSTALAIHASPSSDGHLVSASADSGAENDAWIDRALVTTAAATPLAILPKPRSSFAFLKQLPFFGRKRY